MLLSWNSPVDEVLNCVENPSQLTVAGPIEDSIPLMNLPRPGVGLGYELAFRFGRTPY